MTRLEKPPRRRRLKQFNRPAHMNRADWIALGVTAFLVGMVLYPVFAKRPGRNTQSFCQANLQQISLALLAYAQDYDECFPVAVSSGNVGGAAVRRNWAVSITLSGGGTSPSLLYAYTHNNRVFEDHFRTSNVRPLAYMYNDLAAASRLSDFVKPSNTVIVVDGEELLDNVGHAWEPKRDQLPNGAIYNAQGRCDAGLGAFVTEFATTRHNGGANYAFADGHVKWFNPGDVYFPPRASASVTHRDAASGVASGPEPGGNMKWNGRTWAGTFHLR